MIDGLNPYPAYKDSGVPWLGQVPEHWEVKRGKALFRCIDIRSQTGEEELLTVSSERGVVPRRSATVTMFKAESYVGYKLCWPDDLVINSLWAWARGLGVSPYHGIVSSAYGVYRLRNKQQDNPRFIHQLVRSIPFQWELQVRSKGIWLSRLQLTDDAFLDAPFPMPPSHEQAAIVRFLEYMDRRIRRFVHARQRQIKLLEEYRQALIHQAVTGQIDVRTGKPYPAYKESGVPWLGQVPEHWNELPLKRIARIDNSGNYGDEPERGEVVLPVATTAHITSAGEFLVRQMPLRGFSKVDAKRFTCNTGDILVVKSSGSVFNVVTGKAGLVTHSDPVFVFSNFLLRVVPNEQLILPQCLYHLLSGWITRERVNAMVSGTTYPNLRVQEYASALLPLPPLSEQTAIVEYLDAQTAKIDAAIAAARREIELVREYRTRLIADVVTGKVDVREVAARLPEEPPEEESEWIDTEEMAEGEETDEDSGAEALAE
jgi:type I restriction enzyme S subunit